MTIALEIDVRRTLTDPVATGDASPERSANPARSANFPSPPSSAP
jgi:L-ascorbate metabolism protein UlaG (beta-lactamase superfamily)